MPAIFALQRQNRNQRRGAALVEAAMVLPVIILFLFGILEYGRYFMMIHECSNAASAGANYAAKHTSQIIISGGTSANTTAAVQSVVNSCLGSSQLTNPTTTVFMSDSAGNNLGTWTSASNGSYIAVQLSGTYNFAVTQLLDYREPKPRRLR